MYCKKGIRPGERVSGLVVMLVDCAVVVVTFIEGPYRKIDWSKRLGELGKSRKNKNTRGGRGNKREKEGRKKKELKIKKVEEEAAGCKRWVCV